MKRVIIVGGGIAGLAAAYRLKHSAPEVQITLIESDDRLGGKIVTERVAGFVIEGGPDTFLSYKPRGLGLCRDLGIENRLHGTNEKIRRTYVMRQGKLYDLPEGLTGLIPSRFGPMVKSRLISPWGKLRMGLDYFIPPKSLNGDESLAQFVERRLGRELYDRMIEPLMSGIYAGDGEQLSLGATFPQLRQTELEYGSLVKGMLAAKKKSQRSNGIPKPSPAPKKWAAFITPETGLAEIVEALQEQLKDVEVRLNTRVKKVTPSPLPSPNKGEGVHPSPFPYPQSGGTAGRKGEGMGMRVDLETGETLEADAVILATPAYVTAQLVGDLDPDMAAALRGIPYASTITLSMAYPLSDIPKPLNGYGYIIPRAEGRSILACTWTSTKFPHRAPEGYGLIRAFIGRAGDDAVLNRTDDELLQMVRAELRDVLGITAEPQLYRIFRWPQAMPQYTLGHLDRIATIDRRLAEHPGLYVAGNAYRGIGLPDCIASGEAAANAAVKYLQSQAERVSA
ncbi:protoporphyrinogen/coproporphyrinogen III oxidase [Thermoflexales bacterium]|nr:protoporphyrinogen/coproporphyrinogen III oxidase [Thermoflexales bacterium]